MALLAICCFFPLFSLNPFSYDASWVFIGFPGTFDETGFKFALPAMINIGSLLIIYFAYRIYSSKRPNPFPQNGALFNLACNEWHFDKIYDKFIVKPVLALGLACFWTDRRIIDGFINLFAKAALLLSKVAAFIDRRIIDGFINLLVQLVRGIGNFARRFQGGKVQYYLYSMLVVLLVLFILGTFI